jgi:flagellar M-ring protein FliF
MLEGPPGSVQRAAGGGGSVGGGAAAEEDESMVDMANIEGQIRASSLRRLSELVDKHPEASLGIIRAWMQREPS